MVKDYKISISNNNINTRMMKYGTIIYIISEQWDMHNTVDMAQQ